MSSPCRPDVTEALVVASHRSHVRQLQVNIRAHKPPQIHPQVHTTLALHTSKQQSHLLFIPFILSVYILPAPPRPPQEGTKTLDITIYIFL